MTAVSIGMTDARLIIFRVSLGWVGIIGSPGGLRRLILPLASKEEVLGQAEGLCSFEDRNVSVPLADLCHRLRRYFDGEQVDFYDRLDLYGYSSFLRDVWEAARSISYGQTRSYRWIAERISKPRAMRAVGQALGKNPLPIIIPCHRVVRSDGGLGGFSGGLEMKRLLLRLENSSFCINYP